MKSIVNCSIILIALTACAVGRSNKPEPLLSSDDPVPATDPVGVDAYDWTPEGFKKYHYDEWTVVYQAIAEQQGEGDTDFAVIDSLVRGYIAMKDIDLPSDEIEAIQAIEQICQDKFDIGGYDDDNFSMHIADGTRRLFAMYVGWLYEGVASSLPQTGIDRDKELDLYSRLNDAFYDVCDSVAFRLGGSLRWTGVSEIESMKIDYEKNLNLVISGRELEEKAVLDVPVSLFWQECDAMLAAYKPFESDQPQDVSHIIERLKQAYRQWYNYRKRVALSIGDPAYQSLTERTCRQYLLHIKNRCNDIGPMSSWTYKVCLKSDCSNEALLDYCYEERAKW